MSESSREAFEKWIGSPPYEHDLGRMGECAAWPGQYRSVDTQLAWEAWQEAEKRLWKAAENESNKIGVKFGQLKPMPVRKFDATDQPACEDKTQ